MRYAPMLAVASTRRDVGDAGWAYEFKWDGVRAVTEVDAAGGLTMFARSGNDITARYPEVHGIAASLGRAAVLDGEVVALDAQGRPSFEALQPRMHLTDPARVAQAAATRPVALFVFDLLELDGAPLIDLPYEQRRQRLRRLELGAARWQVPGHHGGDPDDVLRAAAANGLEGIVAKRLGSPYRPGRRSEDWRKVRLTRRQEFVVGGFQRGRGGRSASFGSLAVGYHDPAGRLRYAGSVGSGFSDAVTREFQRALDTIVADRSPFADPVPRAKDVVFVEPRIVIEVQFSEWTRDGNLRQPSYKGLRSDKTPAEVVYEPGTPEGPPVRDTGADS